MSARTKKLVAMPTANKVTLVAIETDLASAACKFMTTALTGRSTMLAVALHSLVCTGNEFMLLLGAKRNERALDE
jgi:divalent metal cation (Fe/Co/Zn/Cd) transporter